MKIFDKLFSAADKYLKKCSWKDIALLKFCLCAIGILIGLSVAKEKKRTVRIGAGIIFTAAYVSLMVKFLPFLIEEI